MGAHVHEVAVTLENKGNEIWPTNMYKTRDARWKQDADAYQFLIRRFQFVEMRYQSCLKRRPVPSASAGCLKT